MDTLSFSLMKWMVFTGTLVSLFPPICAHADSTNFEKVKTQDGITVFKRKVEQVLPETTLTEAKSIVKVHAPVATVLSVIHHEMRDADVKEKQGNGFLLHGVIRKKPISAREVYMWLTVDCKNQSHHNANATGIEIVFTTKNERVHAQSSIESGAILLPILMGRCELWPAEDPSETYVEYRVLFDLGGSPAVRIWNDWAVRTLAYRSLVFLREEAEKGNKPNWNQLKADLPHIVSGCLQ